MYEYCNICYIFATDLSSLTLACVKIWKRWIKVKFNVKIMGNPGGAVMFALHQQQICPKNNKVQVLYIKFIHPSSSTYAGRVAGVTA